MGAKVSIKKNIGNWTEIYLSKFDENFTGFVLTKDIVKINNKVSDWVAIAEQLIGTPYKWGGRDTIGLDCSALIQLSYQTYGENIPRNTVDQVKVMKKVITDKEKLFRGCVIFWDNHVGVMTDNLNCIHSNAYHMKTIIEPLDIIVSRMGRSKILKIMDFNR